MLDRRYDVICFSHLRWDFVYQRPQHLLARCAELHRTFYIEEPVFDSSEPRLEVSSRRHGVVVVVPHLPEGVAPETATLLQRELIDEFVERQEIREFVLWYYTPMALEFSRHLKPVATVYDCMDELSAFRGAAPELQAREIELLQRADVVFTGGQSLYELKRTQHPKVSSFPSSVDVPHFRGAREPQAEPPDQAAIPHPRLGFYGVIDERMDLELLAGIAASRPDWHLVIIGPTVKIDADVLPDNDNIHYLGSKSYDELPTYLSGWDVAILPFAQNDATRFISPTKTPEYLAGGKPVVSTSIRGARGIPRPLSGHR